MPCSVHLHILLQTERQRTLVMEAGRERGIAKFNPSIVYWYSRTLPSHGESYYTSWGTPILHKSGAKTQVVIPCLEVIVLPG